MKIRKQKTLSLVEFALRNVEGKGDGPKRERIAVDLPGAITFADGDNASKLTARFVKALQSGDKRVALATWLAAQVLSGKMRPTKIRPSTAWALLQQWLAAAEAAVAPSVPKPEIVPEAPPAVDGTADALRVVEAAGEALREAAAAAPPSVPVDAPEAPPTHEALPEAPKRVRHVCGACGKVWYKGDVCPACGGKA